MSCLVWSINAVNQWGRGCFLPLPACGLPGPVCCLKENPGLVAPCSDPAMNFLNSKEQEDFNSYLWQQGTASSAFNFSFALRGSKSKLESSAQRQYWHLILGTQAAQSVVPPPLRLCLACKWNPWDYSAHSLLENMYTACLVQILEHLCAYIFLTYKVFAGRGTARTRKYESILPWVP